MLARDAGAGVDIKSAEKLVLGPDCRRFSYAELETATNGYTEANVIGEGGFGKVHALCSWAQRRQGVNCRRRLRAPQAIVPLYLLHLETALATYAECIFY
jgi:hypothetical protein